MSLENYRVKVEEAQTRLNISIAVSLGITLFVVTVTAGWVSVPNDVVWQWAYECAREGCEQVVFWLVTIALLLAPIVAGGITYALLYAVWVGYAGADLEIAESNYLFAKGLDC